MGVESHSVGKHGVQVEFLLADGEDPDGVDNTDAVIKMPDGRRWGATLITVREVERILARWRSSGESAGGLYLRVPDLILMSGPGIEQMVAAIADLVENDQQFGLTPLDSAGGAEGGADAGVGE
ncbi:hypothetical protein M6D93_01540 [Jatrophihabitans telluris]|uniref:Uncharacterized protein n=1 Tax=Jatrophihabitans telluris TaxID=2038343 RepID=A0ABY4QYJ0_9ACTN|nr:hypothetical protein [Jatrophihabitans telluris]UQX88698.1 hypothetical protein M6D93_01540 [Jatrophihabitans telluris]